MHPRIAELFQYLDEQHAVLLATIAAVPAGKQSTSPEAGAWSVAQIVEHLALLERRLIPLFAKLVAEARLRGVGVEEDASSFVQTFDVSRFLDRTRKIVSGETTRPSGSMPVARALEALGAARRELKTIVLQADGLALGTIVQAHPAFGSMNFYEWVAFLGAHTTRHAMQIRDVRQKLEAAATA